MGEILLHMNDHLLLKQSARILHQYAQLFPNMEKIFSPTN